MSTVSRKRTVVLFSIATVVIMLACSVSTESPTPVPAFDPTKAALELQATTMAIQLTQAALNNGQPQGQPVAAQPTVAAPPAATEPPPAAPTDDVEAKIRSAKVLLYEDTDELGVGQWIQDALDGMGINYTQTGSYSGHFMEYLDSGVNYDLIIVGAENRDAITGEFWDVISRRLARDKAALIAEVWYLRTESVGPISKILGPCGVHYRVEYPLAQSIYWWSPTNEVFNEPNTVLPLLHYNRYWPDAAGDKLTVGGGDATMLAGLSSQSSSGEGVVASCFQGRVIIQTFCNHDYRQDEIMSLWQNYVHYTLKNHFAALH